MLAEHTKHHERDLDFFGDLNKVLLNDVKTAMQFDKTCLSYFSQISFAYTRREVTDYSGKKTLKTRHIWMTEMV
jgi:hypothetical protein